MRPAGPAQRIGIRSVAGSLEPSAGMMVVMALAALQRRRHLIEADRAVAVLVELAEHVVGLREVGAAGAERLFEFRLG